MPNMHVTTATHRHGWVPALTVAGVASAILGLILLGMAAANRHADIQRAWSAGLGGVALGLGLVMVLLGVAFEPAIRSAPVVSFTYWTAVGASLVFGGLAILSVGVVALIAGLTLWAVGSVRRVPKPVGAVAGAGLALSGVIASQRWLEGPCRESGVFADGVRIGGERCGVAFGPFTDPILAVIGVGLAVGAVVVGLKTPSEQP